MPVPMSAILAVGERAETLGWMRKPRVLVVMICCSSSLGLLMSWSVGRDEEAVPFWDLFDRWGYP